MSITEQHTQDAALQDLLNPFDASQISDGIDGSIHGTDFKTIPVRAVLT
jgi:hypothetical protein